MDPAGCHPPAVADGDGGALDGPLVGRSDAVGGATLGWEDGSEVGVGVAPPQAATMTVMRLIAAIRARRAR